MRKSNSNGRLRKNSSPTLLQMVNEAPKHYLGDCSMHFSYHGANGNNPGGALDQILVGDVPSRFQKHTRSLYQFLKKYTRPYTKFSKKYILPYTSYQNLENQYRWQVPYTKIVKIDTVLYTNIWKIDTLPDGTSPYPKYM